MTTTTYAKALVRTGLRDQNMVQNHLLIWIDKNMNETNNHHQNMLEKLRPIVNQIITYKESEYCIKCLHEMDNTNIYIVIFDSLDEHLLAQLHDMKRVHTIYLLRQDNVIHVPSPKEYPKIEDVFTDIGPICQSLRRIVQRSNHNAISMSFVSKDVISLATDSNQSNLDDIEPTFMYSVLFKEIILEINDNDNNNHAKSIKELVAHCRSQNVSEYQLNEFQAEYKNQSPIWWYTKSGFLYTMLNQALRIFDTEVMIKMSFFIRNLHRQIKTLQMEQLNSYNNDLVIYRGQGLSQQNFDHLFKIKGGLISFNSFLSTSKKRDVAMAFAESAIKQNEETVGVLFMMTINLNHISNLTAPFANINDCSNFSQEEEILFSMHTVFRVGDIKELTTNSQLWEVQLILTDVNDPELVRLTERMKEEIDGEGWYRMGKLMLKVGHFNQAEILYNELLKNASNDSDRAKINQQLGETRFLEGKYEEAIAFCEKTLEINGSVLEIDYSSLVDSYNCIGRAYFKMGNCAKALEFYEKARKIKDTGQPSDLIDLSQSYHHIASVYDKMGDYWKAIEFYEKAHTIKETTLPSNHPSLAMSYNSIGMVYDNAGDYTKAREFVEKAIKIGEKTLPPNHPNLGSYYNNMGVLYNNMGDFAKALQFYEKARKIWETTYPSAHSDLGTCYCSIGLAYNYMGDYAKALEFYAKDLEITKKVFAPNHSDLATSYNNVGQVYYNMGEYSKALEYHCQSLKIWETCLPSDHQNLAFPYIWFGRIYRSTKDYEKSLNSFEKCLSIREKALSKDHPLLAVAYTNIGDVHRLMCNYEMALEFHQKALNIQENIECDPTTCATTYVHLGETYREVKDYQMAFSYFEKALQIRQQKLPNDHPDLAVVYHSISKLYLSQGEYSLAMKNIQQAVEIGGKKLSSTHPYLVDYRDTFEMISKKL